MEIAERPHGLVAVIIGDIGVPGVDSLQKHFLQLTARHPRVVILDCGRMSFISSLGMGAFVALAKGIRLRGGRVMLAALQPPVLAAFRHARLHDVFDIHATADEALAAAQTTASPAEA
jgi:anti-anti-sigma factor